MYYNENTIIYYKGSFIKAVEAKGNPYDQSLQYGYAVFEGIRAYDTKNGTRIFKAKEHYDRLKFSAGVIAMPYTYDNDELTEITYEVLRRNNLKNAYIRPLVSCTPNMSLTKGKDIANPIGSILSTAMMLEYLSMDEEAALVREAVAWLLNAKFVTKDIDPINYYFTSTIGDLVSDYVADRLPNDMNRSNIELRKSTLI